MSKTLFASMRVSHQITRIRGAEIDITAPECDERRSHVSVIHGHFHHQARLKLVGFSPKFVNFGAACNIQ